MYCGKLTPDAFSYGEFSQYILECAIRARESFRDSITPEFEHQWTPEITKQVRETSAEIHCMQGRLRKVKQRRKK